MCHLKMNTTWALVWNYLPWTSSKWFKLTVKSMYIRFQTTTLLPFVHLDLATRIHLHAVFFSFFVALFVFWDIFSSRVRVDIVQNIRTMSFCIVAVCLMFCLNFYFYFLLSRAFVFFVSIYLPCVWVLFDTN